VLPHRGGGGETYVDMLDRMQGFEHQRFYLSAGRSPMSGLSSIPVRWPWLAARLRATDLVHTHGDMASMIVLPLLRMRPAVMTAQGMHLLRRATGPRRELAAHAVRAVASASRAVICSSASEFDDLAVLVRPRDGEKLRVIPNGIDAPPPVEESERRLVREELGVGPEVVLGLFVGQLEERKAPLLAASAATQVHAAGIPFVLAVAGDGPQAAELQRLTGDAVRFLGYRSDVQRLLKAADVFVQPSEREGMSFALLEAMAHGLAVVASDGPGNPEAVGDAGLLFGAGDEAALVAALKRLGSEPMLRTVLGQSARARALERFGPDRFIAATEAVYLESLGSLMVPDRAAGGARA
jgi:glycosyltransferase involved in cell wall biosynthesis